MMRTLVLISGLGAGGAERVTVSLLRCLRERGTDVLACTVTRRHDGPLARELRLSGVERRDLGVSRLADARAVTRLVQLIRAERVGVIHAHGQDACIIAGLASAAARTPLAITRHVLDEPRETLRQRVRAGLALRAFRHAHAPVAVSRAAADRLAELAEMPRSRIRVIPNGINLDAFRGIDGPAARADLARTLPIQPEARLMLVPAVLRAGKGHEHLIEAVRILARRVTLQLLIAGSGEREPALRRQAEDLGTCVLFLGHRDDVPRLMAASDLVVLPSLFEAYPTALMEAAAAGRPAVATRVGGIPEIVADGRTGMLVAPGDPFGLADTIATVLLDPELALTLGREAGRHAEEKFSIVRQAAETQTLWDELRRKAA
jgi:glycosyltransferase involved in cell wall biosynthesis